MVDLDRQQQKCRAAKHRCQPGGTLSDRFFCRCHFQITGPQLPYWFTPLIDFDCSGPTIQFAMKLASSDLLPTHSESVCPIDRADDLPHRWQKQNCAIRTFQSPDAPWR